MGMDDLDIRRLIERNTRETEAENESLYEELRILREQVQQASRINAVLVVLFGKQINDERWELEIEQRRLDSYPWEHVGLNVGKGPGVVKLVVQRKDDAAAHIADLRDQGMT